MPDVQAPQTPPGGRGPAGWLWAIIVLALLAVLVFFFFIGTDEESAGETNVEVNAPQVEVPEEVDVDVRTPEGGNP